MKTEKRKRLEALTKIKTPTSIKKRVGKRTSWKERDLSIMRRMMRYRRPLTKMKPHLKLHHLLSKLRMERLLRLTQQLVELMRSKRLRL